MLKTDSETVAVGVCRVRSLVVVDEIVVIKIGDLPAFLLDVSLIVVVEVVASKIHLAVKQGCVAVHTTHPGGRYTIAGTPATAAATHAATAAAHSLHHASCKVVESAVVGVVAV